MTLDELNQFFDMYNKVESRIKDVATLCTDICDCEEITGFRNCGDGYICVRVWNRDCGNDAYHFPLEYLSMTDDEIERRETMKADEARKRAEEEERKEKIRRELKERMEYKRLKKKYEGGVK